MHLSFSMVSHIGCHLTKGNSLTSTSTDDYDDENFHLIALYVPAGVNEFAALEREQSFGREVEKDKISSVLSRFCFFLSPVAPGGCTLSLLVLRTRGTKVYAYK